VVRGEGQVAVVGRPEHLHGVDAVAVGLLDVDAVLERTAGGQVVHDEAVGAVRPDHHVLVELLRPRVRRV
jgi:hypothetical protein